MTNLTKRRDELSRAYRDCRMGENEPHTQYHADIKDAFESGFDAAIAEAQVLVEFLEYLSMGMGVPIAAQLAREALEKWEGL